MLTHRDEPVAEFPLAYGSERPGRIDLAADLPVRSDARRDGTHPDRKRLARELVHNAAQRGVGIHHGRRAADDFVGIDKDVIHENGPVDLSVFQRIADGRRTAAQRNRFFAAKLRCHARILQRVRRRGAADVVHQVASHDGYALRNFDQGLVGFERRGSRCDVTFVLGRFDFEHRQLNRFVLGLRGGGRNCLAKRGHRGCKQRSTR